MRLFIATNFPPEPVAAFVRAQDALRRASPLASFSRRENLHLTLAFLGEQPSARVPDIREAMAAARFRPFSLSFDRAGRFRREEGDVCYLSCAESPPLLAVQRRLARELTERGFTLEDRRFVPHLTLARRVQLPPGFALPTILDRPIDAPARALSLMLSERRCGRLVYTELHHT